MGENEKLEGGQLYIDDQPWDGIIHDEFITLPEQQEDFSFEKPESVTLKFKPSPELVKFFVEIWEETFKKAVDFINSVAEACSGIGERISRQLSILGNDLFDRLLYEANDNPKWWHYYKHAKKARTRKKYRNKLLRQYLKKVKAAKIARESLND